MTISYRTTTQRITLALIIFGVLETAFARPAAADGTDDYPIPHRVIDNSCNAEQYLQAARDTSPAYFERYMVDKINRLSDVQQMTEDRIHWFFSLDATGRRQYSADTATDVCMNYPVSDVSVWDWPVVA